MSLCLIYRPVELELAGYFVVTGTVFQNAVFDEFTEGEYDVPLVDGLRSGKGTQKFKKGDEEYTLECTWENNKRNGEGVLLDPNGVMAMKLFFKDDVVDGEGTLFSNGQATFKGTWKNGKRSGHGVEYKNGHPVYDGNYEDDKRNGFGKEFDDENEVVFEGEWVDNNRGLKSVIHTKKGERKLVVKDEAGTDRFIGECKENSLAREGFGTEFDAEGKPLFEGMYKDDVLERKIKEFKGKEIVLYDENGKKMYEGEFLNKKELHYPAHGQGKEFKDGVMVYKGHFKNGMKEGKGCSYYMNRCLMYDGYWQNDMANGHGKFHNDEGIVVVEGDFEDNVYRDDTICVHVDTGKIDHLKKKKKWFC